MTVPSDQEPRWTATGDEVAYAAIARDWVPAYEQDLDELEDCKVVVLDLASVRGLLRAGELGATEQTYLAMDAAGLL